MEAQPNSPVLVDPQLISSGLPNTFYFCITLQNARFTVMHGSLSPISMKVLVIFVYAVVFMLLSLTNCYSNEIIDKFLQIGWEVENIGDDNDSFLLNNYSGKKSTFSLFHKTFFSHEELEYNNYIIIQKASIEYLEKEYKQKHKDYGYKTIEVLGRSYKGVALIVDPHEDFIQCHIYLTNGSQECWGMFNGPREYWDNALDILKK